MLIITEKPNTARSFASALNAIPKDKYFQNFEQNILITNCFGHLFELQKPEFYIGKNKVDITDLPVVPIKYKYKIKQGCYEQVNLVSELIKKNKDDKIIIATDADREGELIGRIILNYANPEHKYLNLFRFWESEALTKEVVLNGLKRVKPLNEYDFLAKQGYSRQHADWLVGMNLSNYISYGNTAIFSVGRVQTAILNAISIRNKEIENFIPQPYIECVIELEDREHNKINAMLINPETGKSIFTPDSLYVQKAIQYLNTKPFFTFKESITYKNENTPKLLSLTDLSKIAAEKYDYSAAKTLAIAQKLYEEYKCLSYPRTPSNVMGSNDVSLFKECFQKLKDDYKYSDACNQNNITSENKRIFNNDKLESHHALIPLAKLPQNANEEEKNVYNIVLQVFFQAVMNTFIYDDKEINIFAGEYKFKTHIKKIKQIGWKISEPTFEKEDFLNEIDINNSIITNTIKVNKLTEPKKQYTMATILQFMKNPNNDDEDKVKLVSLGTEATRGDILEKLFEKEYVIKKGKSLLATNKGNYLLVQLKKDEELNQVTDIAQTTRWEKQLQENPIQFAQDIENYVRRCIKQNKTFDTFEKDNYGTCPLCQKYKIQRNKYKYYCLNKECNFSLNYHICDAVILPSDLEAMLQGKCSRIKTMTSKNGKRFKAKIKLDITNTEVKTEFVFENKSVK